MLHMYFENRKIVITKNLYSDQLMHIINMFSRYSSALCKKFVLSAQCL